MKKIIHNIRRQPEEIKRHILHVSVGVAGFLLLAIWVHSLGSSFNTTTASEDLKKNVEPLSVLKSNLALPQW